MTFSYTTYPIATLVHISDLHFDNKFITNPNLLKKICSKTQFRGILPHCYVSATALSGRIIEILNDRKSVNVPVGVVFSGDLTRSGGILQFQIGTTFLRGEQWTGADRSVGLCLGKNKKRVDCGSCPALFCIPGNHDIWKRKNPSILSKYRSYFPGNFPITWQIKTKSKDVFMHGVDSAEVGNLGQKLARGRISNEQINDLENKIVSLKSKYYDSIHIVFLHHPIVACGNTNELVDHVKIAKRLSSIADLVLSGHFHKHDFYKKTSDLPNHAIAGSAIQMFSDRDFQLIDIYNNKIEIRVFEFDDTVDKFIFKTKVKKPKFYSFSI